MHATPHAAMLWQVEALMTRQAYIRLSRINVISNGACKTSVFYATEQACVHATPRTAREQQTEHMSHTGASRNEVLSLSSSIDGVNRFGARSSCLCNSCSAQTLHHSHHLKLFATTNAIVPCRETRLAASLLCVSMLYLTAALTRTSTWSQVRVQDSCVFLNSATNRMGNAA